MEKTWPCDQGYQLIKLAQYLAGLTGQQDEWGEIGKALIIFYDADLVAFGEWGSAGSLTTRHWTFSQQEKEDSSPGSIERLKAGLSENNMVLAVKEGIAETLESGFLTSRLFLTPVPLSLAFLPIIQENQIAAVIVVGYMIAEPFPKNLLNTYLAVAVLVGTITARLASERELHQLRRQLEGLVQERTADLVITNKQLLLEIKQRRKAEEALLLEKKSINFRLEFERIISEIYSNFVKLPAEKIDAGINFALSTTGEFFQADRSYVYKFSPDGITMSNTYEWCREGIEAMVNTEQDILIDSLPWWSARIRTLDFVFIPDVSALPEEATPEKKVFQRQDIQSLFTVPMLKGEQVIGFFGFDYVRNKKDWVTEDAFLLKLIAEILVSTFEKNKADQRLQFLATYDELTGLWNRRFFLENAEKELARAKRYGQPFTLLLLDIDHFKKINDSLGHEAGDLALNHFALTMKKSLREVDMTGRLGGEEFCVLLPFTELDDGVIVAENLRKKIENTPARYNNNDLPLTVSIGVTAYCPGSNSIDELLKIADECMYAAKARGRNCVIND